MISTISIMIIYLRTHVSMEETSLKIKPPSSEGIIFGDKQEAQKVRLSVVPARTRAVPLTQFYISFLFIFLMFFD